MMKAMVALLLVVVAALPAMAADLRPYRMVITGTGGSGDIPYDNRAHCIAWLDKLPGLNMIERPGLRNPEDRTTYIYRLDDVTAHTYGFPGEASRRPTSFAIYVCIPVLTEAETEQVWQRIEQQQRQPR